jgi:hypothetical protein
MNFQILMDQQWSEKLRTGKSKINFPDVTIKTVLVKPTIKKEFTYLGWINDQYNDPNSKVKFDKDIGKNFKNKIRKEKKLILIS